MLNLSQIKRRISAIKSTKKVIEAMRLISISAYPKISKSHEFVKTYREEFSNLLSSLAQIDPESMQKFLPPQDHRNCKVLLIIVGSSKGLCGSFNSQLERHAKDRITIDSHQTCHIITVGRRAERILSNTELIDLKSLPEDSITKLENLTDKNIDQITSSITSVITAPGARFSQVMILANSFKSIFSQKPKIRVVLPISPSDLNHENEATEEIIWEQPSEKIIRALFYQYIYSSTYSLLSESVLSEISARFVTTDGATQNASKQIENLSLQYNKLRQGAITREVTELSSST